MQDTLAAATTAYTYDPVGNRTRVKRTHIANPNTILDDITATTNALNQYTAYDSALPTYDANGNLTAMGSATYSYDARSLLVAAEGPPEANPGPMTNILNITHDTRRRITRLQHNAQTTTTYRIYDNWNLIAEYAPSGTLLKEHIHGTRIDEILLTLPASGPGTYHHHDALGNVVALTNAASYSLLETYTTMPLVSAPYTTPPANKSPTPPTPTPTATPEENTYPSAASWTTATAPTPPPSEDSSKQIR